MSDGRIFIICRYDTKFSPDFIKFKCPDVIDNIDDVLLLYYDLNSIFDNDIQYHYYVFDRHDNLIQGNCKFNKMRYELCEKIKDKQAIIKIQPIYNK